MTEVATYQTILNATVETTQYMLNSVSPDGSWGTVDYTDWGSIITALNVNHLLFCGLSVDEEWMVLSDQKSYSCSIKVCLGYLATQVHDDGSFGADFWDTCKLATLIVEHSLYEYFDYDKIKDYIIRFINDGGLEVSAFDYSKSVEWSGPGTYAACVNYLLRINERDLANSVLTAAISLQQPDGSFVGKKTRTGDNVIHPIWHTSQMLEVILKSGYSNNANLVDSIVQWIESVQGSSGEYDDFGQFVTYYTSYAALAFLKLGNRPQPYTDQAIDYLVAKSHNGKYDDFGGTIMVAMVYDAYLNPNDLRNVYQTIQLSQAKKLLVEVKLQKEQIAILSQKLEEYDEKYKDVDIAFSKKEIWKLGLWIGFLTMSLGIVVPVIVNVIVTLVTNSP